MRATPTQRRIAAALAASLVLHILAIWLAGTLVPPEVGRSVKIRFRPRFEPEIERFVPTPPVPVARELLEQLRREVAAPITDVEAPQIALYDSLGDEVQRRHLVEDGTLVEGEDDKGRTVLPDSLSEGLDAVDLVNISPAVERSGLPPADPVELDAMRRQRTVVVIDDSTGRLKRAYVHLPLYSAGGRFNPASALRRAQTLIERGFKLPGEVPVEFTFVEYRLGRGAGPLREPQRELERELQRELQGEPQLKPQREPQREPLGDEVPQRPVDPIHRFANFPQRHLLHASELQAHPVLYLPYIDIESTQTLARHLLDGGYAVMGRGQLDFLHQALAAQEGEAVEQITVGLEHPLFKAHFDIGQYSPSSCGCCPPPPMCPAPCCVCPCPPVGPLAGLQLDGRLIAVENPPPFHSKCACPSNNLFINVLVYGLQTHRMGGRYAAP
ncbi:MAG: hypothetical protein GKR89_21815 [Candidatus Latescibacteria bacterium]|nr:hypothetical protein [Candidatus Latescibacterota bacterium]